jgi:predicted metal-dependent hydrolase
MLPFLFRRRRRRIRIRRAPRLPAEGDALLHLGERLTLRITENNEQPQGCAITGAFLEVNLPDADACARREEARLELQLWRKREARRIFRARTDEWAQRLGIKYREIKLTNARRLWGSCSARDDVRLNWRLIMAPPSLLDYVIVHELCHVTHKNHGPRFWRMVTAAMPDWKIRRLQLRAHDPGAEL